MCGTGPVVAIVCLGMCVLVFSVCARLCARLPFRPVCVPDVPVFSFPPLCPSQGARASLAQAQSRQRGNRELIALAADIKAGEAKAARANRTLAKEVAKWLDVATRSLK